MDFENLRENHGKLIQYLTEHDYEIGYIARHKTVISVILRKNKECGWLDYDDIYHYFVRTYAPSSRRQYRSVLINICEFDLYGKYPVGNRGTLFSDTREIPLYSDFDQIIKYYKSAENERGWLKESTIERNASCARAFFIALQSIGIKTISDITEKAVLSVFLSEEGKPLKSAAYSYAVKEVLRSCSEQFPIKSVMALIPAVRKYRKNIQYLTQDESKKIRAVLANPDSTLSLRDRAIGTLAYYTGLRSGDICRLKLDSIDLQGDRIHIIQQKTKEPLDIPLKAVVGNAIYDYVALERPKSNNPAIFLTKRHQQLSRATMWNISDRIMKAAEVRQGDNQRKGLHIFRHHLATTLLGKGVPQPVISGTLGQTDPASVETYFSSDFVNLKTCALSVNKFPVAARVFS